MRLPVKVSVAARERAEFALRTIALGALVIGVLQVAGTFNGSGADTQLPVVYSYSARNVNQPSLLRVVQRLLTSAPGVAQVQLLAKRVPDDSSRALLSALRAAAVPVEWTDSTGGAALAIEASALVDPKGGVLVRAAAPSGMALSFRDSLGLIDTVTTRSGGSSVTIGQVAGSVQLSSKGALATSVAPPAAVVRRILVIANPGWEAKFTTAALEERGWNVDVRYSLGRNVTVTEGQPLPADTARYAAVIALDSAALPRAAEIRRYASMGGGVVIAGAAGTLRELGDLLPGKSGAEQDGVAGALATNTPLAGVSWRPITADSDAVVLSRNGGNRGKVSDNARIAPSNTTSKATSATDSAAATNTTTRPATNSATVVVRRFGAGRVAQIAYDAVWQWRMAGPDGSVEAHRQWWSNIVGLVAFAPAPVTVAGHETFLPGNSAPYADLAARLGRPVAMPARQASAASDIPWELLLLTTAVVALLLEWTSRRLRGAR